MGARERVVLVVEDEWLICLAAIDILVSDGFEVMEAVNSDEALVLLNNHNESIHVLFTDVHMPGTINGLELAHHTSRHWPSIGILIASGHARPLETDLPARSRFLAKPYEHEHVLTHIRELADVA